MAVIKTEVTELKKGQKEIKADVKSLLGGKSASEEVSFIEDTESQDPEDALVFGDDKSIPPPPTNCTIVKAHFSTAWSTMHACIAANEVDGSTKCPMLKHHCGDQAWKNFCANTCKEAVPGETPTAAPTPYASGYTSGSSETPVPKTGMSTFEGWY